MRYRCHWSRCCSHRLLLHCFVGFSCCHCFRHWAQQPQNLWLPFEDLKRHCCQLFQEFVASRLYCQNPCSCRNQNPQSKIGAFIHISTVTSHLLRALMTNNSSSTIAASKSRIAVTVPAVKKEMFVTPVIEEFITYVATLLFFFADFFFFVVLWKYLQQLQLCCSIFVWKSMLEEELK